MLEKEIYRHNDGYGYIIKIDGIPAIKQPHKPAVSGLQSMTEEQANKLADLVIAKLNDKRTETETIDYNTLMSKIIKDNKIDESALSAEELARLRELAKKENPALSAEEVNSV